MPEKHIIIVAGEASGDLHAAHLVQELKHLDPSLTFSGLGGIKMKEAGVEIYQDLTRIAVVGFSEVIKHYREFKKAFDLIVDKVTEIKPGAVILVDYPGFNLRLAKILKEKFNTRIIYYISPQVWAWKQKRIRKIKKYVDKMLVIFNFEKDFYARIGMKADFVGHPLLDSIKISISKEQFLISHGLANNKLTIGLLPGSREKEVKTLLPIMLEAAQILAKKIATIQFLVVKAPTIQTSLINKFLKKMSFSLTVIEEQNYDAMNACDLCMVASGTATLETAILQKPMVVVYKTSLLTWLLAKLFVKIPDIGLVNVVAGKRIVPECIQFQATGSQIAVELKNIFTNEIRMADIKSNLRSVRESLGEAGASQAAARKIYQTIVNQKDYSPQYQKIMKKLHYVSPGKKFSREELNES